MSNKSKAKAIADLLMSDSAKWWGWDDILESLIPGFSMIPHRSQREIVDTYITYIPHVYAELDERKKFLLRDGIALRARFKIATAEPEDRPEIEKRLGSLKKIEASYSNRIETRVNNLKEEKILPASFAPASLQP